ncbi:MAG: stalk domain-containing protein [Candidatus Cohnella colombiensis]|uniref:Stalk domain-containing protein n=1 Tax=Candidatus Cohnella colombiensis TaxID=3121368 RepID=A0AA95J9X0_9BACL|nr:MAG: stalk domain-containing protein [Cohnella sp.]
MAKKRLIVVMCMMLCIFPVSANASNSIAAPSKTAQAIEVFIDNVKIFFNVQPIIDNGTTLVEFRPIFEKLGLRVEWDSATQTVSGIKDNLKISLLINSKTASINGEAKKLLQVPRIIDGHTFIPLRFVGEATHKQVDWDENARKITISSTIFSDIYDVLQVAGETKLKYEGDLIDGKKNGAGKLYYLNKLWYDGQFREDTLDGQGKLFDQSGSYLRYEGQFKNSKMDGQGNSYSPDGTMLYEGQWSVGLHDGFGVLYNVSGKVYDGHFKQDQYDGEGKLYYASGTLKYEGSFKSGVPHGAGILHFSDNSRYEGEFSSGKMNGSGKYYSSTNVLEMSGKFADNQYLMNGEGSIPTPILGQAVVNGKNIELNYSDGYSYIKAWTSDPALSQKIGYAYNLNTITLEYFPDGYPEFDKPDKARYNLLTLYKYPKSGYKLSSPNQMVIFETKEWVYTYTLDINPIPNDEAHKAQFEQFQLALSYMKQLISSIKTID